MDIATRAVVEKSKRRLAELALVTSLGKFGFSIQDKMEISGVVPAPTRDRSVRSAVHLHLPNAAERGSRARARATLKSQPQPPQNCSRTQTKAITQHKKFLFPTSRRDPSPDPRVFSLLFLPDTRFVAFCRPPPLPRVLTEFSATGNCFPILREKSDCAEVAKGAPSGPTSEVTIVRSGSLSALEAATARSTTNAAALICKTERFEMNRV